MPHGSEGTSHYEGGVVFLHDKQLYQSQYRKELGPEIAVIHESAHAWSDKYIPLIPGAGLDLLYWLLMANEAAPTTYAQTNAAEHWAESVAMYIYPEYANILRQEGKESEMRLPEHYLPGGGVEGAMRGPKLGKLHQYWLCVFFQSLTQ